MSQASRTSRRGFLKTGAAAGAFSTLGLSRTLAVLGSPNGLLQVGVIGVGGRGAANLAGVAHENVVALCDVDANTLAAARTGFPKAAGYADFRKLLDRNDLDAIVVSTPDHTHAVAAMAALKSGRHAYCEKPLTHSVAEARALTEVARETGLVTQMGTQIHAGANYRRVVELIRGGAIGEVNQAHAWVGKSWGGGERPTEVPPVPATLDWDLWLGPAPARPYHPTYHPANWRRWWDFGGGTLADMGCHYLDLVFWALGLSHCTKVEASGSPPHPETAPTKLRVRWQFPARRQAKTPMPECQVVWHDGGLRPKLFADGKLPDWGDGVLFLGSDGMLLADYGRYQLLPLPDAKKVPAAPATPLPQIPESIGHHNEWTEACKGVGTPLCNFGYSGPLTESVLLGTVAYRLQKPLVWKWRTMETPGVPEAQALVRPEFRAGWSL
ncbi:MAG TPA: Gfo/Idh/MocA family oxidoreductase [Planctomycetota bacterium]